MRESPSRITIVGAAAVVIGGAALLGIAQTTPKTSEGPPGFKPVQPLGRMMEGQKLLYAQIKDGITDEAWEEAATAAWILAEIANANRYQKDHPDYRRFAGTMSQQCVDLANALHHRDAKLSKDRTIAVGRTCGACHDQFQKEVK